MTDTRHASHQRQLLTRQLAADFVVVGGGLAGICAAITAARQGLAVVLLQDRPVLGGNASSEVRLWILGATSHMGNNNRWAREGGVVDEILVENLWRNPEGNPVLLDALLLEKVVAETRITLLLNTVMQEVELDGQGALSAVEAYCSQNETRYRILAPLFCDASGDGVLGYLAGAAFRLGTEARAEFGELLADDRPALAFLGHSLYFYSRETPHPVTFIPPAFARKDLSPFLRRRELRSSDSGCRLWWFEYGGAMDTIHDTEEIKWELWRFAYGAWDYIKNSGEFSGVENLTLEWVGMIPGKRESRRFEGDIVLRQQDIVEQRQHPDAVSFGGWAIDLHPAQGVYSPEQPCTQWHAKGIYQIPYRALYSRNVPNLFLAGRLISASHIAFGSTRVMATCAHNAQAVGMAAALCHEHRVSPRTVAEGDLLRELQQRLLRAGQYIPGVPADDPADLARSARVTASSELALGAAPPNGRSSVLDHDCAILLPLVAGPVPCFSLTLQTEEPTRLTVELFTSLRSGNFTPDRLLASDTLALEPGEPATVRATFPVMLEANAYCFLVLRQNPLVRVAHTDTRLPGILTLHHDKHPSVAKSAVQDPPEDCGVDRFGFWLPRRRPHAYDLAVSIDPPLRSFAANEVLNGIARPAARFNGWVPSLDDPAPSLRLEWDTPQTLREIQITFDTDYDHPMESVLLSHPERAMPSCVRAFRVCSADGYVLADVTDHHHSRWTLKLDRPIETTALILNILDTWGGVPAIFEVRCY